MKHKHPNLLLCITLLVANTYLLTSCTSSQRATLASPETVHDVALVKAQQKTVPDIFESVGTLRAQQTATMASQVTGYLVSINVREGDAVRQGQTLAVIDDSELRAGAAQAQAAVAAARQEAAAADSELALANSTLQRYQSLYEKKSLSPQEYDEVKTRFQSATAHRDMARASHEQATAALRQSQAILGRARLRSPFNGTVTARQADPGTLATPGMAILTVEAAGHYRLESTIDERDLKYVHLGQNAPVVVDAIGDKPLDGKVVQIVPAADPASRSFTVKVELPANPALRSGLFGRVQFSRGERRSLVIPETAILQRGQLREVYVIGDDKLATLRYVTLGSATEDQVEVLSGLSPGETLVATPGDRELGGKRIEVR